jgi:hypothetical protein
VSPSIGSILPSRPLQRRRNEDLLADHEISSLVVPTAYGTVIESVQLVDEMGIYMEAHEGKQRRGEGLRTGLSIRWI